MSTAQKPIDLALGPEDELVLVDPGETAVFHGDAPVHDGVIHRPLQADASQKRAGVAARAGKLEPVFPDEEEVRAFSRPGNQPRGRRGKYEAAFRALFGGISILTANTRGFDPKNQNTFTCLLEYLRRSCYSL